MTIHIANDYSKSPGGRYISKGPYSGEDFRESVLLPAFEKCQNNDEELIINLDGGYGYGSSFLREAFGGLARKTKNPNILQITLISDEEPQLIDDILGYMKDELFTMKGMED